VIILISVISKDSADGEFSRLKTRLMLHLKRHDKEVPGYIFVKDSESLQRFGQQQMSAPGAKAKLDTREFIQVKPEEVMQRKAEVGKARTLTGIKSKYEYVAFPSGKVGRKGGVGVRTIFFHTSIQVTWRRYPCCCPPCMVQLWDDCQAKELVGPMETVVQPGGSICTARKTGLAEDPILDSLF
jgi:hypothetical protein